MNFTTSSQKPIEKVSSDDQVVGYDLFSSVTYMSILAKGGINRDRMLEYCSRQRYKTAVFFEYIRTMARGMGVEYTIAFQEVANKAKAGSIRSLLLRFSSSISSGGSEAEFIVEEARNQKLEYSNNYERSVDNLQKWTDAYSAVLVAVTLIMVVSQISSLLGATSESFIFLMTMTLFGVTTIGVFLIYKVAPFEEFSYDTDEGITKSRKMSRLLAFVVGIPGFAIALLMGMLIYGTTNDIMRAGSIFYLLLGFSVLPAGFFAWRDSQAIDKNDSELTIFFRGVGNIAGSAGVTLTETLKRLDTKSLPNLKIHIDRLKTRLISGLPSAESWEIFSTETGSDLSSRTTGMMLDGIETGCPAEEVGAISADFAQNVNELRARRRLCSSSFSFLSLAMHITMSLILVFVVEIINNFNKKLQEVSEGLQGGVTETMTTPSGLQAPPGIALPSSGDLSVGLGLGEDVQVGMMQLTIIIVIGILVVANALAPKFTEGGNNLKILWFMSLTAIASGIVLMIVPTVTAGLLNVGM